MKKQERPKRLRFLFIPSNSESFHFQTKIQAIILSYNILIDLYGMINEFICILNLILYLHVSHFDNKTKNQNQEPISVPYQFKKNE